MCTAKTIVLQYIEKKMDLLHAKDSAAGQINSKSVSGVLVKWVQFRDWKENHSNKYFNEMLQK